MSDETHKKIFSENLKYYLQLHNKNQMDLINDLQLSSSTVSNWCTGLKLPRMEKIQLLADYFHIEKSDLINAKPENEKHSLEYLQVTDLLKLYFSGILKWSESVGLNENQSIIIRKHFADLLIRYKRIIEKYSDANLNWKDDKEVYTSFLKKRDADITDELILQSYLDQELKELLKDAEKWINIFPNWIARNQTKNNLFLNAANENPTATPEDHKHDDNLMHDDNW